LNLLCETSPLPSLTWHPARAQPARAPQGRVRQICFLVHGRKQMLLGPKGTISALSTPRSPSLRSSSWRRSGFRSQPGDVLYCPRSYTRGRVGGRALVPRSFDYQSAPAGAVDLIATLAGDLIRRRMSTVGADVLILVSCSAPRISDEGPVACVASQLRARVGFFRVRRCSKLGAKDHGMDLASVPPFRQRVRLGRTISFTAIQRFPVVCYRAAGS